MKNQPTGYCGNRLSMVRSMLMDWVYILCHTCSKLIHLWKNHTGEKPPTCRQRDISSSESNLYILLPSLAKNTFWILDSCVELIFQLKFTLLLILPLISVRGSCCRFMRRGMYFICPLLQLSANLCLGDAAGVYMGHNQQAELGHCLEASLHLPLLLPFLQLRNGVSWMGVWRIKNNAAFEFFGATDSIGYLPHIHFPTISSSFLERNLIFRNLVLLKFYSVGKVMLTPAQGWILSNLSL